MEEGHKKDEYLSKAKLCIMMVAFAVIATLIIGNSVPKDIAICESYQNGNYFVDWQGAVSGLYTCEVAIIGCFSLEFVITFVAIDILIKVGNFSKEGNEIPAIIPVLMVIVLVLVVICVVMQIRAFGLIISAGF